MIPENLTGRRFGRLVVEQRDERHSRGRAYWSCLCDCGNRTVVSGTNLRCGVTKSCGCLKSEPTKHGDCRSGSRNRLNGIWHTMLNRCNNPNSSSYENYGGRGIHICKEWEGSYLLFRKWAIEHGYSESLSIDRVDVNGDYEPSNCRWVTRGEQANNTRANVPVEFGGVTMNLMQWSKQSGIPYRTLRARLINYGWSIERALTTPVRGR